MRHMSRRIPVIYNESIKELLSCFRIKVFMLAMYGSYVHLSSLSGFETT